MRSAGTFDWLSYSRAWGYSVVSRQASAGPETKIRQALAKRIVFISSAPFP